MYSPILMVAGIFFFILGNVLMTEFHSKIITIIGLIAMIGAVYMWVLGAYYYFIW